MLFYRVLFIICRVDAFFAIIIYSYVFHQSNDIFSFSFSSYVVMYVILIFTTSLCSFSFNQSKVISIRFFLLFLSYALLLLFLNVDMQICLSIIVSDFVVFYLSSVTLMICLQCQCTVMSVISQMLYLHFIFILCGILCHSHSYNVNMQFCI